MNHALSTLLIASAVSLAAAPALAQSAAAATAPAPAASGPYSEQADARADINQALQKAAAEKKQVLVVFGANWCKDCLALNGQMNDSPALASHVKQRYVVAKVDVGRFNKNLDIAQQMGNPIKKGIPAVAVLQPDGSLQKATTGGELADARSMGSDAVIKVLASLDVK
jgi:thioredoxin 1